ncbi:hypothetical protein ACWIUD_08505, partial [Helicobacter sp. 23-1044]
MSEAKKLTHKSQNLGVDSAIQKFPLPCGGGLRGWVKSHRFCKSQNLCKFLCIFIASQNLSATELSTLCKDAPNNCTITTPQSTITNTADFTSQSTITIQTQIDSFENHSTITAPPNPSGQNDQTFTLKENSKITHFANFGKINSGIYMEGGTSINIANHDTMGGIYTHYSDNPVNITLNNLGTINPAVGCYFSDRNGCNGVHFAFGSANVTLTIDNYMIKINQSKDDFTNYNNTGDLDAKNSHISIYYHTAPRTSQVHFKDGNSKIILDFGDNFELGKEYPLKMLIVDKSGSPAPYITADFSRLALKDADFYDILESGEYFVVRVKEKRDDFALHTPITELYKSNIRTMNNLQIMTS